MSDDAGKITTRQMRELHALLHEHGVTGDAGVHAYLTRALAELGAEPVESRADLTTVHAAKIISDLADADAPAHGSRMTPSKVRALRADFPAEAQGKLPRSTCRDCSNAQNKRCERHQWVSRCDVCHGSHSSATMHIDFIGHADVTARLLSVDPDWYWEPWTPEQINSLPPAYRNGLWIWLVVLGVRRPGFGHADNDRQKGGDAVKVAIGDALRNAAMRFGIALDLWAKGDRDWSSAAKADGYDNPPLDPHPPAEPTQHHAPRPEYVGPTTTELLEQLRSYHQRLVDGTPDNPPTWEDFSLKFREVAGNTLWLDGPVSVEEMDALPPALVADWEQRVANHLNTLPTQP